MLDLNDIKGKKVESLLLNYKGNNPYIKYIKKQFELDSGYVLTSSQSKYIEKFHDFQPIKLNKIIEITEYFGEKLKDDYKLKHIPQKILVETVLAEKDNSYHILCKLYKNQEGSRLVWLPKTQVFEDILKEEIDVDIDFDKYTELDDRGWRAFKHQEDGITFLLKNKGCILADDMGLGKAEFVDNQVFTPFGRQRIGDIKPGDYVIGSDGEPTLVDAVYPQGVKDLYRVTFNDGYSVLVSGEHLFTVSSNNSGENSKNRENKYHTLSVDQMIDKDLELSTNGYGWNDKRTYKFKTYYKTKSNGNKWQIPIVKPIQFKNDNELPIDPYLLGVCLGDGHIKEKNVLVGLHKDDFDEIFENQIISEIKSRENARYCFVNLGESIKDLKLNQTRSHNKFIPDIYKYSSVEDRLSILQGLMDTDGHCMKSKKGNFTGTEYSTVSEQLAKDVAEIVHSLGGIVRKKSRIPTYTYDGEKREGKLNYRLNIKLPEGMNPFRLKRKAEEYKTPKKYKIGRYIKDIKLEKQGEAVCIQVAADDHLYVTEHGIVTHNTYQSIVAALETGAERVLIVCPSSLKINWKREIENFTDDVVIVNGTHWQESKFTILNYDIIKNFHTVEKKKKKGEEETPEWMIRREIVDYDPDIIILDEAHYVKNPKSQRGDILKDICKNFSPERVWLLTGTPIANRPMDYFNLLTLIKSPVANNWVHYAKRYCEGRRFKKGRRFIWVTDGASNLDELSKKTQSHILRRKKEDVLDLPDKLVTPVYLELENVGGYERVWEDYLEKRRKDGKKGNPFKELVEMTLLRTFVAMETVPHSISKAEEAVDSGKKVIIFCNFSDEIDAFLNHFKHKAVCVRGGMSADKKQQAVDRFQEDPNCMVFVGQIKAAGVGLTLTEAEVVIMNSLDWVPGNHEQAEDRAYRIGQNKTVNIYYMLIAETIDDLMWRILNNKKRVIGTIMGESELIDEFIKNTEDER